MGHRRRAVLTGAGLSSSLARWTQPGFVRAVQRGTIALVDNATSAAATISAVDVANTFVTWGLYSSSNATSGAGDLFGTQFEAELTLTNSTTVTATITTAKADGATTTITYEVVEFYPGVLRSVQYGTVTIAGGSATGTATMIRVDTTKAFLISLGADSAASFATGAGKLTDQLTRVVITNGTTITATRGGAPAQVNTAKFCLVEFC